MRSSLLRRALRTTLALVAVATVSAVAGAQPPAGGQGGGRGNMQQMLFEGITLTDAQKKSIDSVQTAARAKVEAGEDRRAVMQAQRDAVRGLLTDDQKKTYDANMEKMRANMRRPGGR